MNSHCLVCLGPLEGIYIRLIQGLITSNSKSVVRSQRFFRPYDIIIMTLLTKCLLLLSVSVCLSKKKSRTRIQLTRNAYFLKLWFLTVCMISQSSSRTSHICSNYEYSSKLWEITVAENKSFWLAESFRPARLFFERSASAAHNLW